MTPFRLTVTLLTVLFALVAAPAAAQTNAEDYTMQAYGNIATQEIIIVGELDAGSSSTAQQMVAYADADYLSEQMDVTVLQSEILTGDVLLGTGADAASLHAVLMDTQSGLMVVAAKGESVWLFLFVGPTGFSGEAAALFTRETLLAGEATAPDGYLDMTDSLT